MRLFSNDEVLRLREKAKKQPEIRQRLIEKLGYLQENELIVPKESRADWLHYYYCHDDAQMLKFDINSPKMHICPRCGRVYEGDPYDGVWEHILHNQNTSAVYYLGLLFCIDENQKYAQLAYQIIYEYAKVYPEYRPHGNIPYNRPGKAHAQAIDEAVFFRELCLGYDLIKEIISKEKREFVEKNLFEQGARFLMEQVTMQIHNHEVLIDGAIAMIGLAIDREEYIQKGIYDEYGLLYQLEQGTLADGMWFEGSFGYQSDVLEAFFISEIFARHSEHSNLKHPMYLKMLSKFTEFMLENGTLPRLNDGSWIFEKKINAELAHEFGYNHYRDSRILAYLNEAYKYKQRDSIDAFFYGADTLPEENLVYVDYHDESGSGLTIFRGEEQRYLLIKHAPYGGEHDHYDRLSLSFSAFGDEICSDMGTVRYGVPWHYDYFKNTATHNTVNVRGENQPPENCRVFAFDRREGASFLDVGVAWRGKYQPIDSFVIKQWSDEAYNGTGMRRKIWFEDSYFVDVFTVEHPEARQTDWVLHVVGDGWENGSEVKIGELGAVKPYSLFKSVCEIEDAENMVRTWKTPHGFFKIHIFGGGGKVFTAKAPMVPPDCLCDYLVERQVSNKCVFVNVFESFRDIPAIERVEYHFNNNLCIKVNDKEYLVTAEELWYRDE